MHKDMVYTCTVEYYSAIRKSEITPFAATWIDLEVIVLILSEGSQKEKNKYQRISLICGL